VPIGRQHVSLLLMMQATLSLLIAISWRYAGKVRQTRLMAAESVQVSLRVMLTKLSKALFVLLAV